MTKEDKKEVNSDDKKVEVAATTLGALMDKLDALAEANKQANERVATLEAMAGENALKSFHEGRRDHTIKRAHLKVVDGQSVVSWGNLLVNRVYKLPNGTWKEDQQMKIQLLDGTEKEMDYAEWVRVQDIKFYTIKRMSTVPGQPNAPRLFSLANESGEVIDVLETFVNP